MQIVKGNGVDRLQNNGASLLNVLATFAFRLICAAFAFAFAKFLVPYNFVRLFFYIVQIILLRAKSD